MTKAFFLSVIAFPAVLRGQLVVYDPAVHTQQIVDQAENLAKYVQMVENQVQQIQQLTAQLQELQQYNKAFGDPSRLLNVAGVNGLVSDLRKTTRLPIWNMSRTGLAHWYMTRTAFIIKSAKPSPLPEVMKFSGPPLSTNLSRQLTRRLKIIRT
jgi:hypothetical protein